MAKATKEVKEETSKLRAVLEETLEALFSVIVQISDLESDILDRE